MVLSNFREFMGHEEIMGFWGCISYLARPFLKMRREQRFSIVLFYNFLKVYASIFDFLH